MHNIYIEKTKPCEQRFSAHHIDEFMLLVVVGFPLKSG
jgi:hypothetical protein